MMQAVLRTRRPLAALAGAIAIALGILALAQVYRAGVAMHAQAEQQREHQLAALHASACEGLGKAPGSAEHAACLTALQQLAREHDRLSASQNATYW